MQEFHFDACICDELQNEGNTKGNVFSIRDKNGISQPYNQRPEVWNLYNGMIHEGENVRVFPLSKWSELDIWRYIQKEKVQLPSLYFAHERKCIKDNGKLVAVSPYMTLHENDTIETCSVRYRTIGDMTRTSAIKSTAATVAEIIEEIENTRVDEGEPARMDGQLDDNIVLSSKNMNIFSGGTLIQYLENCSPSNPSVNVFRFSVQYVHRKGSTQFCFGKMISGLVSNGDKVSIFPHNVTAFVRQLTKGDNIEAQTAYAGDYACLFIESAHDIERGDMLGDSSDTPQVSNEILAKLCWLDTNPLAVGKRYILQMRCAETLCHIDAILEKLTSPSSNADEGSSDLSINEFALVSLHTGNKVAYDKYCDNPECGRGIIIDAKTYYTSGVFIVV